MAAKDVIYGINGPVVTVRNTRSFSMMEMVYVGEQRLVGEIIGINDKFTTVQVYEETTGLKPGDPITGTGAPMNVLLGPGIIDNIFDGIERPAALLFHEARRCLRLTLIRNGTLRSRSRPAINSKAA